MDIRVDAFIDGAYIENGGQKIEMYQRLATLNSVQELEALTDEMIDRYGTPTRPVETLLKATAVRLQGKKLGLSNIVEKPKFLELKWQRPQDMPPLARLEPKLRRRFRTVHDAPMTLCISLQAIPDTLSFLEYLFKAIDVLQDAKGE